ncbi:MAG: pirin family protein [Planctomycetes bacterium]|nr:pirin family protein [Planctomycetota bacterium]
MLQGKGHAGSGSGLGFERLGMITVRQAEDIFRAEGVIENGTFDGRWHFSFGEYYDPRYTHFGTLRVFNDGTLSPGAVWPLHPHREIEVVTYCAAGEFRHADEHGKGGVLEEGWVQHTTVGKGMYHSEINNRRDQVMRFIQMWFVPHTPRLKPAVQQKAVEQEERANRLLPLISNDDAGSLPIASDAQVYACFLQKAETVACELDDRHGGYLYVVEGGGALAGDEALHHLDAAMVVNEPELVIRADEDAELLLVVARLE